MDYIVHIVSATVPLLIVLIGLAFAVVADPYISPRHRRVMLIIVILSLYLVLRDSLGYLMETQIVNPTLRTWNAIFGYAIRPVILVLFLCIVGCRYKMRLLWALVILNALIHLTALFSWRICFGFPDNVFHRGVLGYTSHIVSAILLLILALKTIREYSQVKHLETWIAVANALLVVVSTVLDSFILTQMEKPVSFVTISMVCSTLFYYIWLHLQFVRKHETALVAGQRVQLTLSQIKPHFLYNTLNAISALCLEEPNRVKPAIDSFANYLRGNMEYIDEKGPIPFKRELEHTMCYLEIEQMRFEDALQVRYDITCTSFRIPALTLEPLVENAVRHGVRRNRGGRGTVTISSREARDHYEVIIADDGPGFDPARNPDDGKPHVGIVNVRERLAQVCGGRLDIQSKPGLGTTATIILPREQEAQVC